jgi:hypothetical protein
MDTLTMLRRLLTVFTATAALLAPPGLMAQEEPDRTLAEVVVTDVAADWPIQNATCLS